MIRAVIALALVLSHAMAFAADIDVDLLPNPLSTARPGQWVQYRINTLFGVAEQKQTLVKVDGQGAERVFTIKSEMTVDNEVVDERTDSITYEQAMAEQDSALEDAENVTINSETITFKDITLDCVVVAFLQDGKQCRLLMSDRIPLVGMVRMDVEGMDEPAMELMDFGQN